MIPPFWTVPSLVSSYVILLPSCHPLPKGFFTPVMPLYWHKDIFVHVPLWYTMKHLQGYTLSSESLPIFILCCLVQCPGSSNGTYWSVACPFSVFHAEVMPVGVRTQSHPLLTSLLPHCFLHLPFPPRDTAPYRIWRDWVRASNQILEVIHTFPKLRMGPCSLYVLSCQPWGSVHVPEKKKSCCCGTTGFYPIFMGSVSGSHSAGPFTSDDLYPLLAPFSQPLKKYKELFLVLSGGCISCSTYQCCLPECEGL